MSDFEDINFDDIADDGFSIITEEINISDFMETNENDLQTNFPILAVRNMVMFPSVMIPITAGRKILSNY